MGISANLPMLFDLANLIAPVDGLQDLAEPFQQMEIDLIVKRMPTDKAPGPDGFNGLFMKKCWHIIRSDFYSFCNDFYLGSARLECINTSFITLVPKIDRPEIVSGYRPISLMNSSPKLVTKILADRLQSIIIGLIRCNQYGFIKTRTIQDYLAWSFEYIHQCHRSRRQAIILKLDFEKAFHPIDHSVIL